MEERFERSRELGREPRLLPAATYNLMRSLLFGAWIGLRRLISRRVTRLHERGPSAILGAVAEPVSV